MLTSNQFQEYFQTIHGSAPFPWQQRLLNQVVSTGQWPSVLSLPTGAGKTAILDISLFALACGARIPRRTVLVVDRRIVVDDAFRRAQRIREQLSDNVARKPILQEVRDALLALGGDSPLEVALLRGGIYREDNWVRDPLQPTLVCSTVDQVGSRLLHQGYGVSPHSRSIHAGLLANDSLIILDEAHTSEPFRQTLEWVAKYRELGASPIKSPFAVVTMTATPRDNSDVFYLDESDRQSPILTKRLEAKKQLRMVRADKAKDDGLVAKLVDEAIQQAKPGKTVLVVANRVKIARQIAEALENRRTATKNALDIETPILLTGRSRSLERDRLLEPHQHAEQNRLFSGRDRDLFASAKPLIVVATQCVEVGADLDVDALITEACPLDSLRQRLGRLDRLGMLANSDAVIVAPQAKDDESWDDLVYGDIPAKVWSWFKGKETQLEASLNVGISGFEKLLADTDTSSLMTSSLNAPVMFPAYCDLWVQTSPEPSVVPDPAIFLHGPQRGEPEVQIIWRADLDENNSEFWAAIISECPPVVGESLRIPLYQARKWLESKGKEASEGSDLEGEIIPEEKDKKEKDSTEEKSFLRWLGKDSSEVAHSSRELRPSDTIVVPCTLGGCDTWGWAPDSTTPVSDLADDARFASKRSPIIRIHTNCMNELPSSLAQIPLAQTDANAEQIEFLISTALNEIDLDQVQHDAMRAAIVALKVKSGFDVLPHPSKGGWIIRGKKRMSEDEFAGDDDTSSRLSKSVLLKDHLQDIQEITKQFTKGIGFSNDLADDLILAASLHDLGKADPRFQALLHGGSKFQAARNEILAKSAQIAISKDETLAAREKSGYPKGARHELLSVRLVESSAAIRNQAHDWDLVLHLIGSHHGRCRPFAPVIEDITPRIVSILENGIPFSASSDNKVENIGLEHIASGVAERFWSLVRKYGWWGLSYLEACMRLADWKASALEEKGVKP